MGRNSRKGYNIAHGYKIRHENILYHETLKTSRLPFSAQATNNTLAQSNGMPQLTYKILENPVKIRHEFDENF
jgi:hypothetical protein